MSAPTLENFNDLITCKPLQAKDLQKKIKETIVEFFYSDGEPKNRCISIAKESVNNMIHANNPSYFFDAWDSMGCDDLGLVAQYEDLKIVYMLLGECWNASVKKKRLPKVEKMLSSVVSKGLDKEEFIQYLADRKIITKSLQKKIKQSLVPNSVNFIDNLKDK